MSMPTSRSSAPATRACGPRTRCARADPTLRVVVCEREHVGFGASGRNGGWCSALFAGRARATRSRHGRDAAIAMQRAMFDTLDEIERVVRAEGIDCDWARGGSLEVATLPVASSSASPTSSPSIARSASARTTTGCSSPTKRRRASAARRTSARCFTPHCAAIHPAKLVHGLAARVERAGVHDLRAVAGGRDRDRVACAPSAGRSAPRSSSVRPRRSRPTLPGLKRAIVPVYSLMIATEPLPDAFWADAGLHDRETFTDARRLVIYGQRTADGRFAFGGRGAPYHFGSRVRPEFDEDRGVSSTTLRQTLWSLFPELGDAAVTHRWGGAVGVPRDWYPSVGFDRATRHRVGRRLRRRRRVDDQPRRPHARRPHPRPRHRHHASALGRARVAAVGTGAAALGRASTPGALLVTSLDRADAAGRVPDRRTELARTVVRQLNVDAPVSRRPASAGARDRAAPRRAPRAAARSSAGSGTRYVLVRIASSIIVATSSGVRPCPTVRSTSACSTKVASSLGVPASAVGPIAAGCRRSGSRPRSARAPRR